MATPGQIKKIHALKGALKLDDDTYRQILGGSGVKSSKDRAFTILIADELIDDLERKAIAAGVWEKRKPAQKAFPSPKRGEAGRGASRRLADDPQSRMLRALWIQLHQADKVKDSSERALCSFVRRLTRKDALQWLSDRDVTVVKKALEDWLKR